MPPRVCLNRDAIVQGREGTIAISSSQIAQSKRLQQYAQRGIIKLAPSSNGKKPRTNSSDFNDPSKRRRMGLANVSCNKRSRSVEVDNANVSNSIARPGGTYNAVVAACRVHQSKWTGSLCTTCPQSSRLQDVGECKNI